MSILVFVVARHLKLLVVLLLNFWKKITSVVYKCVAYKKNVCLTNGFSTCFSHNQLNIYSFLWAYGVVVSMFDFHCSDRGPNPGRGSKIS